jgi:hypothetical protein
MNTGDVELERLQGVERAACARFLGAQGDLPGGSPVVEAAEQLWRNARRALELAEANTTAKGENRGQAISRRATSAFDRS